MHPLPSPTPIPTKALSLVGDTLRFDARAMGSALTTRRVKAGGEWITTPTPRHLPLPLSPTPTPTKAGGEWITTPVKLDDALRLRDGFAKAIYSKSRNPNRTLSLHPNPDPKPTP